MELVRGDTGHYNFTRKDNEGHAILTTPLAIYFTVKESYDADDFVIQKTLNDMTMDESGKWHFTLLPSDTETLPFDKYVYDIEVTASANEVNTIAKGSFELLKEATWSINK